MNIAVFVFKLPAASAAPFVVVAAARPNVRHRICFSLPATRLSVPPSFLDNQPLSAVFRSRFLG